MLKRGLATASSICLASFVFTSFSFTAVFTSSSFTAFVLPSAVFANPVHTLVLEDGAIRPAALSVASGEKVTIHVSNSGTRVHNIVIPDFYIFSNNLNPGEDVTVSFTADKTGRFPFYSDASGKPEPGMSGTLTVQ